MPALTLSINTPHVGQAVVAEGPPARALGVAHDCARAEPAAAAGRFGLLVQAGA